MAEIRETIRTAFRRVLRLESRRVPLRAGRLERVPGLSSAILGNTREITVYVPPGYDDAGERRYPVLYMLDGQNLFDPERAFIPGQHWRLREAADAAIRGRTAAAMIIVGVDHAAERRAIEYTPVPDPKHKVGGEVERYGRMLVEELKPSIDERFRTLHGAGDTAVGGSSLGGLAALWLVLRRRDVFGRAVAMSPSIWWGGRVILDEVERFSGDPPRLWLDIGGREGAEALRDARALRDAVVAKRWPSFHYHEDRRGDHSERAWARRVRAALEFLFPPG